MKRPGWCGLSICALLLALASGCATDFEDPSIVLDLRVLGVRATPPEVMVEVDPDDPFALAALDVPDVEVCALVADPAADRELSFELFMCAPTRSGRCDDPDGRRVAITADRMPDPDRSAGETLACGVISGDASLWEVLSDSVRADVLAGFGGIGVQVEISVGPADRGERIYATKRVLYSPKIPESRAANDNPSLDGMTADGEPSAIGRCADPDTVGLRVEPGQVVELSPVESEGARETYVLPTFDGGEREFVENLSYAWFAGDGEFSAETTGGPVDAFGLAPTLATEWIAPEALEPGDAIDIWVVARDERGGAVWYPICVRHHEELR